MSIRLLCSLFPLPFFSHSPPPSPPPPPHGLTSDTCSTTSFMLCVAEIRETEDPENCMIRILNANILKAIGEEVCADPYMAACAFPADLTCHSNDSRLPSRACQKSIKPSTPQTCEKPPLPHSCALESWQFSLSKLSDHEPCKTNACSLGITCHLASSSAHTLGRKLVHSGIDQFLDSEQS